MALDRDGFNLKDTLVYVSGEATSLSLALTPTAWVEEPVARASEERAPQGVPSRTAPPASPVPTSGTIGVRVSPAGVPVQLDGETVGVAPLDLKGIPPGPHTLKFFLPDYETTTVHVEVEPGARASVDVTLVPQVGTLSVVVRPWGTIYVDDVLRARETDVKFEATLPVGRHHIRVEHPELGVRERTVEIESRGTASVVFDFN